MKKNLKTKLITAAFIIYFIFLVLHQKLIFVFDYFTILNNNYTILVIIFEFIFVFYIMIYWIYYTTNKFKLKKQVLNMIQIFLDSIIVFIILIFIMLYFMAIISEDTIIYKLDNFVTITKIWGNAELEQVLIKLCQDHEIFLTENEIQDILKKNKTPEKIELKFQIYLNVAQNSSYSILDIFKNIYNYIYNIDHDEIIVQLVIGTMFLGLILTSITTIQELTINIFNGLDSFAELPDIDIIPERLYTDQWTPATKELRLLHRNRMLYANDLICDLTDNLLSRRITQEQFDIEMYNLKKFERSHHIPFLKIWCYDHGRPLPAHFNNLNFFNRPNINDPY